LPGPAIHEGHIDLIKERAIDFGLGKEYSEAKARVYGERKQLGAYQYIQRQWLIWERIFEREKDLVAWRRTEEAERPAAIADRAYWDAVWAAANPRGLKAPSSHMVCRALVRTALKMENNMRFGGHNMGKAPVLLGAYMTALQAAIEDHATDPLAITPVWWTKEGGGGLRPWSG
jgi:hypothetical protein